MTQLTQTTPTKRIDTERLQGTFVRHAGSPTFSRAVRASPRLQKLRFQNTDTALTRLAQDLEARRERSRRLLVSLATSAAAVLAVFLVFG